MAEWFSSAIAYFLRTDDGEKKLRALETISIKLRSLPVRELEKIANDLNLYDLFPQLTSKDRQVVEEVCNILRMILSAYEPGEAHRRYSSDMRSFLKSEVPCVKTLALAELLREAEDSVESQLINDADTVGLVIARIGDEDLGIAKLAMDITKKIGANVKGARFLYSGTSLRAIARLLAKNDTVSFRVYEVVVTIAKTSKECMEASQNSGFLTSLINTLSNDDVLLQLNTLEVMTDLALDERGLEFLEEHDVLRRLAEKIARANEDPLSNLLIPGLMKFFGGVARFRPNEIFSKYPVVVSALFECVQQGEDPTLLGNALDTLGLVASGVEGKYALQVLGDSMPSALKKIGEIVQKMSTELRLRALEALALILRVEKTEQDDRILCLTQSWFDGLCDDPLGMIVSLCKQPFADIRGSSLEVLATISTQPWGKEYIANCPGLIEFLLDRNSESFKHCKESKYRIVKNLCNADTEVLDSGTLDNLKKFLQEGPFHVDNEADVAIEGAS